MKKTLLALLALLCTPFALRADTLYVTPTGAGNKDGSSWANAFAGIQAAVDAADAAYLADGTIHDILVTNGVYSCVNVTNNFALQVRSVNGAAETIIDGYNTNNCVRSQRGNTEYRLPTFAGFTLQNGDASIIEDWWQEDGGGAAGGTLIDCIIQDCKGYSGGGTYYSDTIRCIIRRCTASGYGGGVYYGTHQNTLIYENTAFNRIVYNATLYNCTIVDNAIDYGNIRYSGSVYNCIFWGNTVDGNPAATDDAEDPKFVGHGDYRPRVGSPAIDGGESYYAEYAGDYDLAGGARVQGDAIDRGCYEGTGVPGVLVTAFADGNGSVSPEWIFTNANEVVTIEADTATYDRQVVQWTTNGVTAAWSGSSLTLAPLANDVVVTARFEVVDWYVDGSTGSNSNPGYDSSAPFKTIAKAISSAAPDETIYVAPGTYSPIDTTGHRVHIVGIAGAEETFIDGGGSDRCALLSDGTTLTGFTLQNGKCVSTDEADGGGGGAMGGALFDCTVRNCVSTYGGGVFESLLVRCTLVDNSGDGGGLYGSTAYDCFIGFNAGNQGGAARRSELYGCTVVGNRGLVCGAISSCSAYNCVFYGNRSPNGRSNYDFWGYDGNCFDQPNFDDEEFGEWWDGTSFTADPLFVDPENGDYRLRAGSPCLDYGEEFHYYDPAGTDIAGEDRVSGPAPDLGCHEGAVKGHVLSVRTDGHGLVSARTIVVDDGADATVVATEDGRPFQHWLVDGVAVRSGPTLNLYGITADHVLTACFERRTTDVSGGNGALQTAIDAAVDGDTLLVAAGTYSAINAEGRVLDIVSADGPDRTIIQGKNSILSKKRAVTFSTTLTRPTCTLSGFTVTDGGSWDTSSGGAGVIGGFLTNCIVRGNWALLGGGAAYCQLTHCRIDKNTALVMGAGAIESFLDNCLVVDNEVSFDPSSLSFLNLPADFGGGAGIAYSSADFCTITRNTSDANAGGAYFAVLDNTYVGGNKSKDTANPNIHNYPAFPRRICTEDEEWAREPGCIDAAADDTFVDAENGDFRLKDRSLCIDAGDDSSPEAADGTDFAGAPRWRAKAPDIGCYEAGSIVPDAVAAVAATRSDAREDVLVEWERTRGAERYAIYRSETDLYDDAEPIASADFRGSSFVDDTAAYATKYWYWVVPYSEAGTASPDGSDLGYWTTPLVLATASLPAGTSPYEAPLAATGGIAPYAWSVTGSKYQFTTNDACTFTDEGFADVGWDYKDGSPMRNDWTTKPFPLPFKFPYFGVEYTNVWISSDGVVQFGETHFDRDSLYDSPHEETGLFPFSEETFLSAPAIAPYIHDSYDSVGTIFSKDAATIVWSGQAYHWGWGSSIRVSLTLYPNGEFDFKYGDVGTGYDTNDEPYARYGYSSGTGEGFLSVIGDNLAGAPDRRIRYEPAPAWMSARGADDPAEPGVAAGVLSAAPPASTTNEIIVAVADGDGRQAFRRFRLVVLSDGSLTGYYAWAAANDLGGPEQVTDGQPNLIRYAFDKPTGAFSPITGVAFDASGKPVVSLLPLNAAAEGYVKVKVLSTTNLTDWAHAEEVDVSFNGNGEIVFPDDDEDTRFYRVKAKE